MTHPPSISETIGDRTKFSVGINQVWVHRVTYRALFLIFFLIAQKKRVKKKGLKMTPKNEIETKISISQEIW